MQRITARDRKNGTESVAIEMHGRLVVVVLLVEEYDRLSKLISDELRVEDAKQIVGRCV